MAHFFYHRAQKSGIAAELFYNGVMKRVLVKIFDDKDTLYMSPTRARNLIKLLQEVLEYMPDKADEL